MVDYQVSKPDPLSDVVAQLKPQAVAWRAFEAHDAWSVRFAAVDLVVFGQMIEGTCQVELPDGLEITFAAGDFLLLVAPSAWIARTVTGMEPIDFEVLIADPDCLLSRSSEPVISQFIAGAFLFGVPNADLLADLFVPVIHIRGADVRAGRLGALLKLLGDEAVSSWPGRSLILDRLLEVILIESLRHHSSSFTGARLGLLAGLTDPQIGNALRLMHNDAQRPWTVAGLARELGMSRSSFAARFAEIMGLPPIEYLSKWRITLAKAALKLPNKPMFEVARLAGYQSVSAFSTAFSRATGASPTEYSKSTKI